MTPPRVVILERLKKLYATFSIPRLLAENGIDDDDLIPPEIDPTRFFNIRTMHGQHFTPLWYYDDTEFDGRNADEWVKSHNGFQLPVPATAYTPIGPAGEFPGKYNWTDVNAIDYHPASKLYSVVLPNDPAANVHDRLHRIQIHFKEEDPRKFVNRIKRAISLRDYCEKSMLWYMYMDKIDMSSLPDVLSKKKLQQIFKSILKNDKMKIVDIDENSVSNRKTIVQNTPFPSQLLV